MKTFIILSSALIASAAAAQQQQAPAAGSTATPNYDPNEIVCRMITETGSRLNRRRACMTRANWEASQRQDRAFASDAQLRQVNPQCMNAGERATTMGRYNPVAPASCGATQ